MRAQICDRCGIMWKDDKECMVYIHNISIYSGGTTASCRKASYDLCEKCYNGLFEI
jgi:hypothetical protein